MAVQEDFHQSATQQHLSTWRGFIRFMQLLTVGAILTVIVLALVTL